MHLPPHLPGRIEIELDELTADALAELRASFARRRRSGDVASILEHRGQPTAAGFERAALRRIFREAVLAHVEYLETHGVPAAGARLEVAAADGPRFVEQQRERAQIEAVLESARTAAGALVSESNRPSP